MHYGDEAQIRENLLEIVIYKHSAEGEPDNVDYEIASIQSCKYFPPRLLRSILTDTHKYFHKKLESYKFEEWYLLQVKTTDGWEEIEILNVENVSMKGPAWPEDWYRLH